MYSKLSWPVHASTLLVAIALSSFTHICSAQVEPASPPIADPADKRFASVYEDLTTPSLATSKLKMAQPLIGYVDDESQYTQELDQVQWRFGDPIDLYIVKPKGIKNPPVILYIYCYPYDTDYFKSEAWQRAVTKDGFAAVGFVTALTGHRYHDRPLRQWFVSELQESLAASAHDVQMILNYLATRVDLNLDLNRIGMLAEGSGATVAILASAVDPRIKVLDTVAPWGDWPTWLGTSPFVPENERADYVKPEFLKKLATLEPLDWLPKIQATRFRLQDEGFDPVTPKVSREKLRAAVPAHSSVVVYNTPDEFNAARNHNKVMDWMHAQLQMLPESGAGVADSKSQLPGGASRGR